MRRELLAWSRKHAFPETLSSPARLGPYLIEEEIGRGGMGVVYRARDLNIDRVVALKVLRPERVDEDARARFIREARAAGRVEHDHLVRVYSTADPTDEVLYLAMEYLWGPSLAGLIKIHGRLEPREAARLIAEAAAGLAAAHSSGLVHRDVKPDNILIDPATGRAKIGDFGLARFTTLGPELTRETIVAGTPAYLSPEQAKGDELAGPLADLYALGVTLYECLAGEPPFRGTPFKVVQQILEDEPRPLRRINEAVPLDLETVCLKAMAKEPSRRYETAVEFAADLRRWLGGKPVQARRVGPAGRLWWLSRRHPRVSLLLIALAITLVGGISGIAWQWRRADQNARDYKVASYNAKQSYREAREAVDRLYQRMLVEKTLDKPGLEQTRAEVARSVLAYYRDFVRRHAGDPTLLADAADASFRVAIMTVDRGDKRETLNALSQARSLLEALARERPTETKVRRELAKCLDMTGVILTELGRVDESLAVGSAGCEIYRQILSIEPNDPDDRRRLGVGLGNLANSYLRNGKRSMALETYRLAREQQEIQIRLNPDNLDDRSYLAMTLHNMSMLIDDTSENYEILEEVLKIRQGLVAVSPGNRYFQRNLARTQTLLVNSLVNQSKFAEALTFSEEACDNLREIHDSDPVNVSVRRDLVQAISGKVRVLGLLERPGEAILASDETFRLLAEIAKVDPADIFSRECLCEVQHIVADARETLGDLDQAMVLRQACRVTLERLIRDCPDRKDLSKKLTSETALIERLTTRIIQAGKSIVGPGLVGPE